MEERILVAFEISIEAALGHGQEKVPLLKKLRICLEVVKRLVRLSHELGILEDKKYFSLQDKIIECSKMALGWLSYMERKGAQ